MAEGDLTAVLAEIMRSPILVKEALDALPALEALARGHAGPAGVAWVIARRFETYPQPNRNKAQWVSWWADYFAALQDQPVVLLEAAMVEWLKDARAQFMPKPGQLLDLARRVRIPETQRWYRVKMLEKAIRSGDDKRLRPTDREPIAPPSDEDRAAVAALMDDYRARMAKRWAKEASDREKRLGAFKAFQPAPVDAGGLTGAMREHLAETYGTPHPYSDGPELAEVFGEDAMAEAAAASPGGESRTAFER